MIIENIELPTTQIERVDKHLRSFMRSSAMTAGFNLELLKSFKSLRAINRASFLSVLVLRRVSPSAYFLKRRGL